MVRGEKGFQGDAGDARAAAGRQFGLEARLRAVLLATAGEISAQDVPPAPAQPLGTAPGRNAPVRVPGARFLSATLAALRTFPFRPNSLSRS